MGCGARATVAVGWFAVASTRVSTLVLDRVTKRFARGVALDAVSLDVHAGEVVGVWGRRRSGRSTLLRVAAGIERPDAGEVRVEGADIWRTRSARCAAAVWHSLFPPDHGRTVERQVAMPLRRGRRAAGDVRIAARAALDRIGAGHCADRPPDELDADEIARVALARALVMRPKVLVLDEPLTGIDVLAAEALLGPIVEIAHQDRIAVLLTAAEVAQLAGVDRHLSISGGALRGTTEPTPADVLRLRRA